MGGKSDPLGIIQESKIWPRWSMVYEQTRIHLRECSLRLLVINWSANPDQKIRLSFNLQEKMNFSSCGFAVPADHRVKKSEKIVKYLDLARELKKVVTHEGDGDTNCSWCNWTIPPKVWKRDWGGGEIGDQRKNQDHPKHSTIKISFEEFSLSLKTSKKNWCEKLAWSKNNYHFICAQLFGFNYSNLLQINLKQTYLTHRCEPKRYNLSG